MKKILIFVLCLSGLVSEAQEGFYLQPSIGVAATSVSAHDNLKLGTYENEGRSGVSVYNFEMGVGYRLNHLEISSGIFYLRSGFYEHTLSGYQFQTYTKTTQYYNHIALPIIANFRIGLGKRFSIVPGVGLEISYNYSDNKTIDQNGVESKQLLTGSSFTSQFQHTSLWWVIRLGFGYKVNQRVSAVVGPEIHNMISSMLAENYGAAAYQRSVILSWNAGIAWNFKKGESTKSSPAVH